MQLDKRMLERLLLLNDAQLSAVIERIATEAGISPSQLGLSTENINGIRRALGSASEKDMEQWNAIYESYKNGQRR